MPELGLSLAKKSMLVYLINSWNKSCSVNDVSQLKCSVDGEYLDEEGNAKEDSNQGEKVSKVNK